MNVGSPMPRWAAALLTLGLLLSTPLALAWEVGDALIVCNRNPSHDVELAITTKAVPHGIGALLGAGWRKEGWWVIPARRCQNTMTLRDVQNYEIWMYVHVVGGTQIYFQGRGGQDLKVCLHTAKGFNRFSWKLQDMQACLANERLETLSYMGSLYSVDDTYSIYNHENRTIDLNFTYP